ncbi:MAG: dTDP-4-dehydrorhamnose 3,5-epimerase family protein [Akkermansiaceae bacterium]|nr:dTDP-4-dehydrorhamnose 3,5-epimerase family protein [Akkermansiaceae bacterium]
MIFSDTGIAGVYIVELERRIDSRGSFSRAYCTAEFSRVGIEFQAVQANLSVNLLKGTLRGMHYQGCGTGESKLVRCIKGAVWDVIIDMRADSPTYLTHFGVELSAQNGLALYVPELVAHGTLALSDGAEIFYLMGGFHDSERSCGIRFDDPGVGIVWPADVSVVSQRDLEWPLIGWKYGN